MLALGQSAGLERCLMGRPPAAIRIAALGVCVAIGVAAGCDRDPELLGEHLRQGDQALAEGRYSQALSAYGHAHELAPTSARVQRAQMWARVYLMADDPARASPEILDDIAYEAELLRKTEPGDKGREAACLAASGNVLARRGDRESARAKLDEAVKTDPASAIAHSALGALLLERREDMEAARASFEKALQLDAGSVRALVGLGQIKLAGGDHAGAAERFEKALERRPDLAACLGLGNARLQQAKHDGAVLAFQRAVALDPRSPDALGSLGQALLGAGRLDEAERALRAAGSLRRDEGTSIALGYTLARLKKSDEALAVFGQVLSFNASAAPALYGAAVASEDLGRVDLALDFYRRVLALPATGAQQPLVAELQKEARGRVTALAPAPASSPSASASAGASASAAAPTGPVGPVGPTFAAPPSSAPGRPR